MVEYFINGFVAMIGAVFFLVIAIAFYILYTKRKVKTEDITFSKEWGEILIEKVRFYQNLDPVGKTMFEIRVGRFLKTKKITAIDTEIDDTIRLLVASSAIIPTFAFPSFTYPSINEVLIYPNAFNKDFETHRDAEGKILGMVGDRFMKGIIILSKPDLLRAFDGMEHSFNVGIHEFVHILDGLDGATDGVLKLLLDHSYTFPWLSVVRNEMNKIKYNKSDINPYALTNEAEFLAVASEYFFDSPEKFELKHPELFDYMSRIFKQDLLQF